MSKINRLTALYAALLCISPEFNIYGNILLGKDINETKKKGSKMTMIKILLADNGRGRGLYFSPDNEMKFIVATIEDNNGIGQAVDSFFRGKYFNTLEEAFEEYKK